MRISVIVPVYNEAENVLPLVEELARLTDRLPELEVVLVDDGSRDGTWLRIEEAMARWPLLVHGVRLARNRGQSAAMLAGLAQAQGEVLVTLDGDLQNNPADIPRLISLIGPDCDVVCGYRANRRDKWSRRMASRLANSVRNRITRDGMRDTGCSLKAFRAACRADLPPLDGVHRFMPAYFVLNGRRIRELAVDHRPRQLGVSKYTNWKRLPKTLFDLLGFIWYSSRYLGRKCEGCSG
ncbi:MAG: glycosyltransferase family 2 protein [bacterium]